MQKCFLAPATLAGCNSSNIFDAAPAFSFETFFVHDVRPGGSLRLLRGVGRFLFEIVGFGACAFFSKSCPGLAVTPKIYRQVCGLDLGRCEPTGFDGKEAISRRTRRTRRTRTRTRTRRTTTRDLPVTAVTNCYQYPLLYPVRGSASNTTIHGMVSLHIQKTHNTIIATLTMLK